VEDHAISGDVRSAFEAPCHRIRARVLLLGVALIVLSARWIFWGEIERYTFLTLAAPFAHAIFLLFAVSAANLWLVRRRPRVALSSLELLALYAMVSVGSAILSADMLTILVTCIGYPAYFADDANRWRTLFEGVLPTWLVAQDRDAVAGFFRGSDTLWRAHHLLAWAAPAAAWSVFVWAIVGAMHCLCVLLRRPWAENERLTFPIVALPVALTDDGGSVLRERTLWIGLAIAGGVTALNGLNYLYPAIPAVPVKRQYIELIASGPLQAASGVTFAFYGFAIAIGFMMPLDLSFALALFYALYRTEVGVVAIAGLPPESRAPYADSQAFGAYSAVFLGAVWRLRAHAGEWLRGLARDASAPQRAESLACARAMAGLGLCSSIVAAMAIAAGMRPAAVAGYFAIFLAISLMITRVRAEFGFPVHDMHQMGPSATLVRLFGARAFDRSTLGTFALFHFLSRAYRGHPMPHQLEALRAAGPDHSAQAAMRRAILLAALLAVPIGFVVFLDSFYRVGASTAHVNRWGTGYAQEAFASNLATWLRSPAQPLAGDRVATGAGFAIAMALAWLRQRVPGAPLHPLAYAAANSWGVANLWLPILIGATAKLFILRATGLPGYRRALLFFYGVLLGEVSVGCIWSLVGMALGMPTYEFWP